MRANHTHRSSQPVALAVLFLLLAAPASAAVTRAMTGEYSVDSARRLELSIPFGEIRIEGTDTPEVRVRVKASCDGGGDCGSFVKGLRLESSNRGGTLRVKLERPDNHEVWNMERDHDRPARGERQRGHHDSHDSDLSIVVEVPRSLQVELNMGAGEVNVTGLRHDLSIDLGAGEIIVRMLERHVGSVDVNMAVGETTIHQGGKTHEYARVLGGPVRWREGKGEAGIEVNVGAGDVDVTLE